MGLRFDVRSAVADATVVVVIEPVAPDTAMGDQAAIAATTACSPRGHFNCDWKITYQLDRWFKVCIQGKDDADVVSVPMRSIDEIRREIDVNSFFAERSAGATLQAPCEHADSPIALPRCNLPPAGGVSDRVLFFRRNAPVHANLRQYSVVVRARPFAHHLADREGPNLSQGAWAYRLVKGPPGIAVDILVVDEEDHALSRHVGRAKRTPWVQEEGGAAPAERRWAPDGGEDWRAVARRPIMRSDGG